GSLDVGSATPPVLARPAKKPLSHARCAAEKGAESGRTGTRLSCGSVIELVTTSLLQRLQADSNLRLESCVRNRRSCHRATSVRRGKCEAFARSLRARL